MRHRFAKSPGENTWRGESIALVFALGLVCSRESAGILSALVAISSEPPRSKTLYKQTEESHPPGQSLTIFVLRKTLPV